jgi:hypothetical protein
MKKADVQTWQRRAGQLTGQRIRILDRAGRIISDMLPLSVAVMLVNKDKCYIVEGEQLNRVQFYEDMDL